MSKTNKKKEEIKNDNAEIAKALYDVAMTLTKERALTLLRVAIDFRD